VLSRQPLTFTFLLRYQAQAERLYRRADFDRLKKLRTEFDTEPMLDPQAVHPEPVTPPETNPPEPPSEPTEAAPEAATQATRTPNSVSSPKTPKNPPQNGAAPSFDPPDKAN
jgi:hypothetical protein